MEENNTKRITRVEFDENGQVNIIYPIEAVTGQMAILNPDSNKTLILIGPAASGKTRFARLMGKDKNTVWVNGRNHSNKNPFPYRGLNTGTDLLVIDDLPIRKLHNLLVSFFDPNITVEHQGKYPFVMARPKTIITCEGNDFPLEDLGSCFTRRFTVMKFPEQSPLLWQTASAYATKILCQRPATDDDSDRSFRFLIEEAFESGASWMESCKPLEVSPDEPIAINIELPADTQP